MKEKGITLIALIITIIIILILAGITINTLTNDGLIKKAKEAVEAHEMAEAEEKLNVLLGEYQIEKVGNNSLTLLDFFLAKKSSGDVENVIDAMVVTIDGYDFIINKATGKIITVGNGGTNDGSNGNGSLGDIPTNAISFFVSPASWSSEPITLNIYYPINTSGTNEYQISSSGTDTGTWQTYEEAITISQNCTVFARVSQNGNTVMPYYAKYIFGNIDTTPPTVPNLSYDVGETSITATASGSTDTNAVTYEYKIIDIETQQIKQDWNTNNVFTGLIKDKEYTVYARAKDILGNTSASAEKIIKTGAFVLLSSDDTGYFRRSDCSTITYSSGSITGYQLNTNGTYWGAGLVTPVFDLTNYSEIRLYGSFGMYGGTSPIANYTGIGMYLTNTVGWTGEGFGINLPEVVTVTGQIPNVLSGYLSLDISNINSSVRILYSAQTYAYFVFDKIVLLK